MSRFQFEFNDNEVKLLVVAVRQVRNTFAVARTQSLQSGEPANSEYEKFDHLYAQLQEKLTGIAGRQRQDKPRRVK